jgi:hypothetical protein
MISKQFFWPYLIAIFIVLYALVFWPDNRADSKGSVPVNLIGVWIQRQSDDPSTTMRAEISHDHIQIVMGSESASWVYWDGSFNTQNNSTGSFQITSTSTAAADSLSQDVTKIFTYKNGDLSYNFRMLGITRIIHLSRGA